MYHLRLSRWFNVITKDVVNLDGDTLLSSFVRPWLAGKVIIWEGKQWPTSTKLTIYEAPRLTTAQQGFGAWLKVHELGEDVTDAILTRREFSHATSGQFATAEASPGPTSETSRRPAFGTTAARRSSTGLDLAGRELMLQRLSEAGLSPQAVASLFLRDGVYSGPADYLNAVGEVWGLSARERLETHIHERASSLVDHSRLDWEAAHAEALNSHGPEGMLLGMPEPDFLTAVELCLQTAPDVRRRPGALASAIDVVCERRGIHFRIDGLRCQFVWTSDATTHRDVIAPAMEALGDERLAGGPRTDFEAARAALRTGTPQARKQAVIEACSAVESAMKILLAPTDAPMTGKEGAQALFNLLVDRGIVDRSIEALVLAPSRFGNRRGRHGPGKDPHVVSEAEAESIVASAATSITYLSRLLPST